jgi:ureidoglycolate lyase
MPETRDLPIQELTMAAFAPFGTVIAPQADDKPFGTGDAALHLSAGVPRFYNMRLPNRGRAITRITRHRDVTQVLASAGGQAWLIAVAPPPETDTADAMPDLSAIRAFRIPGDVAIMLKRGTWHAGPLFAQDQGNFFNLELSDTNLNDHWTCNLADRFGIVFQLR